MGLRPLLIDDTLPLGLDAELRARGRDARHVWPDAYDRDALQAVAESGGVFVTVLDALPAEPGATIAVVHGRDAASRRDVVHRHAHEMASQRAGSTRHYR